MMWKEGTVDGRECKVVAVSGRDAMVIVRYGTARDGTYSTWIPASTFVEKSK